MRGRTALWVCCTVLMLAAGGCASTPTAGQPPVARSGRPPSAPAGYWTRSRLLSAHPLAGPAFRAPAQAPTAHTPLLALRVGALFVNGPGGDHFCTASVVASPDKDLLITAAHCINSGKGGGYLRDIVFIPGYRDGQAPFGIWTPAHLLVAPQWISSSDPNYDVGFVVLQPHDGRNIEEVLGANHLGTDTGYSYLVRVTGYPSSSSEPVTCLNLTSEQSPTQLRFDCGGFSGGTSGSPWVTHFDPRTRTGTIVGVIGGYQQGGNTPDVSYSPYLGTAISRLYQEAVALER